MADMTDRYRVRPLAESDIAEVLELERVLFPEDAWSENMLRQEVSEPTRRYFVAQSTDDAQVIGYAGLRFVPPEGDVQNIAVAHAWWGKGVGAALLTELLTEARPRGVTDIFLEVRSDNPRAQELYQRFGFMGIGVRRGYYPGADAIVMRRSAAPDERAGEKETR